MNTTAHKSCRILASLLMSHGVRKVVVSPGSRNVPIVTAIDAIMNSDICHDGEIDVIIDERSAAFMALGMSSHKGEPVALVCTSGSALLNYLPAVAEAHYRQLPLIVISADRPAEWIGQSDSQTIPQPGVMAPFVRATVDIPVCDYGSDYWSVNRNINHALCAARGPWPGPVHINVQLAEPLGQLVYMDEPEKVRDIELCVPTAFSNSDINNAVRKISAAKRVMIVAGSMLPSPALKEHLKRLGSLDNVAIIAEPISNLLGTPFINNVDTAMRGAKKVSTPEELRPDLLITIGGAIVTKELKCRLRSDTIPEHWHVGPEADTVDCYRSLTRHYQCFPEDFFGALSGIRSCVDSDYKSLWMRASASGGMTNNNKEYSVVNRLLQLMPEGWNVQLSNGLTVRAAMESPYIVKAARIDGNRGVSGIEGSTSTAIGLAKADAATVTLLLTGDMSAAYDIGALALRDIPERFKMVVINNRGGGIFREIGSTGHHPALKRYFDVDPCLPLRQLAEAYGFNYYSTVMPGVDFPIPADFFEKHDRPAIYEIII